MTEYQSIKATFSGNGNLLFFAPNFKAADWLLSGLENWDTGDNIVFNTDVTTHGNVVHLSSPRRAEKTIKVRLSILAINDDGLRNTNNGFQAAMQNFSSVNLTRTFYSEDGTGLQANTYTGILSAISEWDRVDNHVLATLEFFVANPWFSTHAADNFPDVIP